MNASYSIGYIESGTRMNFLVNGYVNVGITNVVLEQASTRAFATELRNALYYYLYLLIYNS